jgi:hypothetical protein
VLERQLSPLVRRRRFFLGRPERQARVLAGELVEIEGLPPGVEQIGADLHIGAHTGELDAGRTQRQQGGPGAVRELGDGGV